MYDGYSSQAARKDAKANNFPMFANQSSLLHVVPTSDYLGLGCIQHVLQGWNLGNYERSIIRIIQHTSRILVAKATYLRRRG